MSILHTEIYSPSGAITFQLRESENEWPPSDPPPGGGTGHTENDDDEDDREPCDDGRYDTPSSDPPPGGNTGGADW